MGQPNPRSFAAESNIFKCLSHICFELKKTNEIIRAKRGGKDNSKEYWATQHIIHGLFCIFHDFDDKSSNLLAEQGFEIDEDDPLIDLSKYVDEYREYADDLDWLEPTEQESGENVEDQNISSPEQVAEKFAVDPVYREKLCKIFAENGNPIYTPTQSVSPYIIPDITPYWKDRPANDDRNPVQFITDNYGTKQPDGVWRHNNLSRSQLRRDKELYRAYATWIGRHPEQALVFAPSPNGGFVSVDNPFEAIKRRRASQASSKRAARAKRTTSPPEPV